MDSELPDVPVLYNYDTDRDASPGLVIAKGGSGPNEGDDAKHQHWQTWAFPAGVTIQGDATVHLWTSMEEPDGVRGGAVTVFLRDCEEWDCVELGSDTVADANWQGGSLWVLKTFSVPIRTHTLVAGHSLELVVIVDGSSDDDMWFAYDTGPYRSRVAVSASSDALTMGAETARLLSGWLAGSWARLLFA